jgi:hypothetical protein
MTKKELIIELSKFDDNDLVVVKIDKGLYEFYVDENKDDPYKKIMLVLTPNRDYDKLDIYT